MNSLRVKSIGTLTDELTIAKIKMDFHIPGAQERHHALLRLIDQYLEGHGKKSDTLKDLVGRLAEVNLFCWEAQEVVMRSENKDEVYLAAKDAQHLNAQRSKIVREIDDLFGDTASLGKSYG